MGLRPLLGPPCIPPKHPLRKVFNFRSMARTRGLCCGSFPFSLRCSGDLPPRRVNAIPSFCFGQRPFQPTIMAKLLLKKLRASVIPSIKLSLPLCISPPQITPFSHRTYCLSCLSHPPSKAGCRVAFLKLAAAKHRRWLVLGEFTKYPFFGLKRKRRDFERSVLKYVSIKNPALTHSGRKSRFCVNAADRLLPPSSQNISPSPIQYLNHAASLHSPTVQNRYTRAGRLQTPA